MIVALVRKDCFRTLNGEQKLSDGVSQLQLRDNKDLLAEWDLAKTESLSKYFGEVYSTCFVKNACPKHTEILTLGPEHVTEEIVLPLTTNL